MTLSPAPANFVAYWNPKITGGWKYLLPPLSERKVLCLSARPVALSVGQASLYGQLTLLHDTQLQGIPRTADPLTPVEPGNLNWRSLEDLLCHDGLLSDEQKFDGFVLHDMEGVVLHQGNLPRIFQLLCKLPLLLRRDGFVYLGARNPHAPAQLMSRLFRRRRRAEHRLVSVRAIRDALRSAGFASTHTHAFLTWDTTLAEVIPQRGYRASKNRENFGERLKEMLYGRVGSRWLAPAYGVVAQIGPSAVVESTLDQVAKRVAQAPPFRDGPPIIIKNYLLFPGSKAIVTLGAEGREAHDVVAVLTTDALAIERRRVEVEVLSKLAQLPQRLACLVPVPLDQFVIGRTQCYLLNRLPGVTLDVESGALGHITEQALEFVIDLHRETSTAVAVDESIYRDLFWSLVEAAESRNPAVSEELRAWDKPLRACVMGAQVPSVWMHGDYKVENIMYDQQRRRLTGVIDWELARNPGLPLLDPLYLLIYNRIIRGQTPVESVAQMIWLGQRSDVESALLRRYLDGVGVADSLVPALSTMFIAHHIGCRLHFGANQASMELLRNIIHETGKMLERSAEHLRKPPPE
ncbi:MAG: aminoglycoside phosphotransferase family protein [Rhizobacter sp.]|nr:aminoglycoside phosphotransferase family protein [Rhizobacter sp.]